MDLQEFLLKTCRSNWLRHMNDPEKPSNLYPKNTERKKKLHITRSTKLSTICSLKINFSIDSKKGPELEVDQK